VHKGAAATAGKTPFRNAIPSPFSPALRPGMRTKMALSSHALTATATLLIFATTSRFPHQVLAWGAEPVPDSNRPDHTYVSSFPTAPSVTVAAGEDVNGAIAGCDDAVGADGYCTVLISSMPPDGKGIIVERSKMRVLGKEGVELVGSGEMALDILALELLMSL
jgi:hypothetical protein